MEAYSMKPYMIGIAGGTGSGKSTFTRRLKEAFGSRITVIYYDNLVLGKLFITH